MRQMAQQELTIKKRREGRRRKFMEAISRWSKLRRDPVADIRIISSENAVAQQVETSGEQ